MKKIIQTLLIDCGDADVFRFSLVCPECGRRWESTPVAFSRAGQQPPTMEKKEIWRMLWERERIAAQEKAAAEAAEIFSICPFCEHIVCDDCFLLCDEIDMCRACAERLQESGEPASFAGWQV